MRVASLNLDQIKQAPMSARSSRTAHNQSYKNPILGIEVNLIKQLTEVETKYHGSSIQKRKILLDALEELAKSGTGFRQPILTAVQAWRPIESQESENPCSLAVNDLIKAQNELKIARDRNAKAKAEVDRLKSEIESANASKEQMIKQIADMKRQIEFESDFFSKPRKLSNSIKEMQQTFEQYFQLPPQPPISEEQKELARENGQLKKDLARMKYEIEIVNQVTKRLKFLDQRM